MGDGREAGGDSGGFLEYSHALRKILNAEDAKITQKTQKGNSQTLVFFSATFANPSRPLRSKNSCLQRLSRYGSSKSLKSFSNSASAIHSFTPGALRIVSM
jgi:hypothetical protein